MGAPSEAIKWGFGLIPSDVSSWLDAETREFNGNAHGEFLLVGEIRHEMDCWEDLVGDMCVNTSDDIGNVQVLDHRSVDEPFSNPDLMKAYWWNPGWLPMVHDGGGDFVCLDADPGPLGTRWQVVQMDHESGERIVLADNWTTYLSFYPPCEESTE